MYVKLAEAIQKAGIPVRTDIKRLQTCLPVTGLNWLKLAAINTGQ